MTYRRVVYGIQRRIVHLHIWLTVTYTKPALSARCRHLIRRINPRSVRRILTPDLFIEARRISRAAVLPAGPGDPSWRTPARASRWFRFRTWLGDRCTSLQIGRIDKIGPRPDGTRLRNWHPDSSRGVASVARSRAAFRSGDQMRPLRPNWEPESEPYTEHSISNDWRDRIAVGRVFWATALLLKMLQNWNCNGM